MTEPVLAPFAAAVVLPAVAVLAAEADARQSARQLRAVREFPA